MLNPKIKVLVWLKDLNGGTFGIVIDAHDLDSSLSFYRTAKEKLFVEQNTKALFMHSYRIIERNGSPCCK